MAAATNLERLRAYLAASQPILDGLFITKPENRSYLSGFTGSFGYLLITPAEAVLFTDGRYVQQAAAQASGWRVVRLQRPFENSVIPELKRLAVKQLGFESDHLTYGDYTNWQEKLPDTKWLPTTGITARLRWQKSSEELTLIRKAVAIADDAFASVLNFIRPGLTERQVAAELEYAMRRGGADAIAFDTIVASGWRGALPHGRASDKQIEAGEFVTIDFGAHYQGYNSDITRTVFVGGGVKEPTERQLEIYKLVLQAQVAGVEAVKPGTACNAVDAVSRQIFEQAGMSDYFLHSLGHNLGREVHETPFLTPPDDTQIEAGMVLTVEPGLYIADWGGVRIEDDLYVTEKGAEVLPRSMKELILL